MSFVQPVSFSSAAALRFRLSLERQLPSKRPDIFTPHTHNDSSPISALYFSLFPQKNLHKTRSLFDNLKKQNFSSLSYQAISLIPLLYPTSGSTRYPR